MSIIKIAMKMVVDSKHMIKDDKTFIHMQKELKTLLSDDKKELKEKVKR
jgi:hypothetical protein